MKEKTKKQFCIVKGIVFNQEGKILLVRRERPWHKESHKHWEFPGGKVDFGENPKKALTREIKEESGYDVEISYLLPEILSETWEFTERESHIILIPYLCKLLGGEKSLEDKNINRVEWCTIEEIQNINNCLPGTKEILQILTRNVVINEGE